MDHPADIRKHDNDISVSYPQIYETASVTGRQYINAMLHYEGNLQAIPKIKSPTVEIVLPDLKKVCPCPPATNPHYDKACK